MSETMVERVARAMKGKLDADGSVYFRDDGDTCMVDGHVYMKALSRAAIEAMREPTHEMMRATWEAMFEDKFDGSTAPMVGAGWEAGIDVALKE